MKKLLSILLILVMLVSFAACDSGKKADNGDADEATTTAATTTAANSGNNTGNNGGSNSDDNKPVSYVDINNAYIFKGDTNVELENALPRQLDPEAIYNSITYTPQMLYGDYSLAGGDQAMNDFYANAKYQSLTLDGRTKEYSILPYKILSGRHNLSTLSKIKGYDWIELYVASRNEYYTSYDFLYGAYTIEGNKIVIKLLDSWDIDYADSGSGDHKITYAFSDVVLEYTFKISGRNLILSAGGDSVTLTTGLDSDGVTDELYFSNYVSEDSESILGIDQMFLAVFDDGDTHISLAMEPEEGETYGDMNYNSVAVMSYDGLFTLLFEQDGELTFHQFVYIFCDYDGIILTDGVNTYYYTDDYSDRSKNDLDNYITEDMTGELDNLTEEEIKEIVEKKDELIDELTLQFGNAGITITVDRITGEIYMDSAVLFSGDSAVLSAEGKAFLDKFVSIYVGVVYSEEYIGFVSKTIIEGHTAPIKGSTYESGLPLSEKRANNVMDYCLSGASGIDTNLLDGALEAVGYSNSKPIMNDDGTVNMEASRRVSFRFIINIDLD